MSEFTTTWKNSTQPRKQRKYRYNAPLHVKQKFVHVHLSKDLRQKHGFRSIQVKKGDKVKILRGGFKGKDGKVDRVSLKREKVYVLGLENIRKEGTRNLVPITPSNLMIIKLDLTDKKRKQKLASKNQTKIAQEKPVEEAKEKTTEANERKNL